MFENAPKYQTAYACEGKKLTIECDPGDLINLIRANYGRFSITICNDHGNVEWSVNCMFPKSLTVLNSRCSHKQSCSVLATTSMFGDPCPGTHKYLEAHYQCISAAQTSTTTNRPSPPWLLTNTPPLLANGSTLINPPIVMPPAIVEAIPPRNGVTAGGGGIWSGLPSSAGPPIQQTTLPGGRMKTTHNNTSNKNSNRHDGLPPPPQLHHHHHNAHHTVSGGEIHGNNHNNTQDGIDVATKGNGSLTTAPPNTRILGGVNANSASSNDEPAHQTTIIGVLPNSWGSTTAASNIADGGGDGSGNFSIIRTINNINNINAGLVSDEDDANLFCGPTNARNMFWNTTRVGDVNVQPCPGGATGIAKWRCVLMKRLPDDGFDDSEFSTASSTEISLVDCKTMSNHSNCENPLTLAANKVSQRLRNFEPTWHPVTPDLTQCRSLWLNNLEVRVNQRDSSLISIANDLSEVTSSKTLYGGDMLVTTKIIQTMSEKMFHDKETFPDQRQREAIILELLHGVVKTGSNLLDESQLSSWLDLNQEDQMRVATSLLTGLEYNAFLLADTIIRERNVVQKVKNILLSVRVLETKNIQNNEVFPDAEQWQISNDRIELPRAALLENSEGGLVRIVFAAFDRLESILKPSYDHFDQKSSRSYVRNTAIVGSNESDADNMQQQQQQQRVRILNSKVISASLGKGRHIQLSHPIKLVLRHLKVENVTNPTCVFWNYIDHAWSANGCSLESTNRTHSVCMCNHLTNFAILMDVMDEHSNHALFGIFDNNLRILIYIGVAICIAFIVIALLTLKIFNGVFTKSARISIYRSIYFCLFFVETLFLFGIEQTETSIFCGFTTVFMHCATLAAIAWFCFEAFQSYSTLTTDDMLIEVDQTPKVNCYYLLSYGLSLTVVAISLIINPSTYTRNDYCVLMEPNVLFYASFVIPVLLFFVAALAYTLLSWIIMCRKSRSTLKNKEHTRLANVRFDIRCSFIFLLLLSVVWFCGYIFLRRAKAEDETSALFGYLFAGFNALMGVYIFIFHCIQNEKIRREYRKYVRQNSWLPKCLRCSKTSISSGIVGGSTSVGGPGLPTGAGSSLSNSIGQQLKKTEISTDDMHDNDEMGGIISAADDAIMATSDCELNETLVRRAGGGASNILKSGSLMQHGQSNSVLETKPPGQIVLERTTTGGATDTLRSATIGIHTPSAGHTSPTSSAGSTHLIFGHGHKQTPQAAGSMLTATHEAYYHQPDYYSWKQKGKVGSAAAYNAQHFDVSNGGATSQQPPHEYFYWTQKHNQHGKKKRSSAVGPDRSPSGSLHSRTTAASQILFYPSYKKTTSLKQPQQTMPQQQYTHYTEAIEPNAAYYPQHQQQRHAVRHIGNNTPFVNMLQQQQQQQYLQQQLHLQQQQQQQQLSSDDEQIEAAAHAHLLHLNRRAAFGALQHSQQQAQQQQRYYRNKHSNCDLNQDFDLSLRGNEAYYNQGSLSGSAAGDGGPVYEEILSNRNSDVQQPYQMDANIDYQHNGSSKYGKSHVYDEDESVCDDEPDNDDDIAGEEEEEEEDEEDDNAANNHLNEAHELPQSDERMRRLMAMQDQDFQRRFQRQQRKKALNDAAAMSMGLVNMPANNAGAYHDFEQSPQQANNGAGSVRNYKKTSPSGRLAVNELFNHAPPLPPANQHPMQKRLHSQQQLLQPISPTASQAMPQIAQQQQPVGRNISAMLDENNMVRCYLEPITK